MSWSFSTKLGSRLTLNVRKRCGLSPCAIQIRRTVAALTPTSLAMSRVLQCVAFAGSSCGVIRMTSATVSSSVVFRRPRPGAFFSIPAMRFSANRFRQSPTVFCCVSSFSAISLFCMRVAACRTIFARSTIRAGVLLPLANFCSCFRSSSVRVIGNATRIVVASHDTQIPPICDALQ